MKLILPNGQKIELDKELPYEHRKEIVDNILDEWSSYFYKYKNRKSEICLEVLSNYLCYVNKEEKQAEVGENDG